MLTSSTLPLQGSRTQVKQAVRDIRTKRSPNAVQRGAHALLQPDSGD